MRQPEEKETRRYDAERFEEQRQAERGKRIIAAPRKEVARKHEEHERDEADKYKLLEEEERENA